MACTPLEHELMQRALQNIDQMLVELQAAATQQQCLPPDEVTGLPFQRSNYREQPAATAVYFCLTSASALLDVSRSLLDQLDVCPTEDHWPGWDKLSAVSKAAGQSAFVAAAMLANPPAPRAAPAHHEDWAPTRPCAAPARQARSRSTSVGMRLRTTFRNLIDAVAV